ncbi:MAG: glycosyltransferase [Chloroflexota bacterium]
MEIMPLFELGFAVLSVIGLVVILRQNRRAQRDDIALLSNQPAHQITPPVSRWSQTPKVSFLVAAWNESVHIEAHIKAYCDLRYPNKELLLTVGGDDTTYQQAIQYAGIDDIFIFEQDAGEGKQKALKRIFPEATGKIIYFSDADCMLTSEAVEKVIYPIAIGLEQACSGASKPFDELMENPIVFSQASSQLYSTLLLPEYAPGLLGRNCAVRQDVLIETDALAAPAPTGTDYVLAKEISKTGVEILQIPESQMPTEYPTSARDYIRQQRRWIRNVGLYGNRYDAVEELNAAVRTSLIGALMLVFPATFLILDAPVILGWSLLFIYALLARYRYLKVASAYWQRPLTSRDYLWQGPLLILDFIAWAQPLIDYIFPDRQDDW